MSRRFLLFITLALSLLSCGEEPDDKGDIAKKPADSGAARSDSRVEDVRPDGPRTLPPPALNRPLHLSPRVITLAETNHLTKEKEFILNVPVGFNIGVAAEGMNRVRFMAMSPDDRLFATDMIDLSDNRKGKVYVLDGFDPTTKRFATRSVYLDGLRNPNSVAFLTDGAGKQWIYVAQTDRLVRYPYTPGEMKPNGAPQTLATFPDSGRGYREGGWHLTRTVLAAPNGKIYVAVGSSCNVCVEKEEVRATIVEMNPDGSGQRIFARGLRNAVGLRWVGNGVWATNMGADHLGLDAPVDNLYAVVDGRHYGWPYVYETAKGVLTADPTYGNDSSAVAPGSVPASWARIPAHAAPLGLEWFGAASDASLRNTFLVALHGSGAPAMKRGYSVARYGEGGKKLGDFINGFQVGTKRFGRPCDILRVDDDSFFLSDDHAGVIYYVFKDPEAGDGGA